MGYTTDFNGQFHITAQDNVKISMENIIWLVNELNQTRRMKRDLTQIKTEFSSTCYGTEGEFYFDENSNQYGQEKDSSIIDYNKEPSTQPGLWMQWCIKEEDDNFYLVWDEVEKFYNYIEWLQYLIEKIFQPCGYVLNGECEWSGEATGDVGVIVIEDNIISIQEGIRGKLEKLYSLEYLQTFTDIPQILIEKENQNNINQNNDDIEDEENELNVNKYKVKQDMNYTVIVDSICENTMDNVIKLFQVIKNDYPEIENVKFYYDKKISKITVFAEVKNTKIDYIEK